MDNKNTIHNNILFNQILLEYFSRNFENNIADKEPLVLFLGITDISKNRIPYFKEITFLNRFRVCYTISLLCKSMHAYYSNRIIKEYAKDFLVRAFILKEAYPSYFNYEKIGGKVINTLWNNNLNNKQLSTAQIQRILCALFITYGPNYYNTGYEVINRKTDINRMLQKNVLLEMIKTTSFFLTEDLKHTLPQNINRFETEVFKTFLNENNAALTYSDDEENRQIDCKDLFENEKKFKKNILTLLNGLRDDQKFSFIERGST
jgi:hypothetical protein